MHSAKIPCGLALTSMIVSTCQYPRRDSIELSVPCESQSKHKCCAIIARQGESSALAALSRPFDPSVSSICELPAPPRAVHRSDLLALSVYPFPFSIFHSSLSQVCYNYTILLCSERGINEPVISSYASDGAGAGRRLRIR